jgi:transposase
MTRQIKKHTEEFKQEAINLALKSPSISRTAKELGIPTSTLHTWINHLKGKAQSKVPPGKTHNNSQDIASLIEENRRLQKELAITREEKEILKKAATYFAQHQK